MIKIVETNLLKRIIEDNWDISIEEINIAPRGFVAETFYVKTKLIDYFVKVINVKSRYIGNIVESIPIIEEMFMLGIKNIPEVIKTNTNSNIYKDSKYVILLFKKINGHSTWDYNKDQYYSLLKSIHDLNPNTFNNRIILERFDFPFEKELVTALKVLRNNDSIKRLIEIDDKYIDKIMEYIDLFKKIISKCKQTDFDRRITHGDAPGNIISTKENKIYLIDWDDLLLAPIERDLWFHEGDPLIGKYYPTYDKSQLAYSYYVLKRFLDDLLGFLEEIFSPEISETNKINIAESIKNDVSDWLLPLVKKVTIEDDLDTNFN
jgi:hypothetical protein